MKIRLIPILACFSLLVTGCGKIESGSQALELKLVDKYQGDYEVGFPIDVLEATIILLPTERTRCA